jgi:hypothetical protein
VSQSATGSGAEITRLRDDALVALKLGASPYDDGQVASDQSVLAGLASRRRVGATVVAVAVGLLTQLGGVTGAAASASSGHVTRADARALAAAISLRQRDLPGSKAQSDPQNQQINDEFISCYGGVPDTKAWVDNNSDSYETSAPPVQVSSEVEIFPTAALATSDLAALGRPRALTCLSDQLTSLLRPSLPENETLTVRAIRLPRVVQGPHAEIDIRVTAVIRAKSGATATNTTFYSDVFAFDDGQAEISLYAGETNNAPPASLERRLGSLLLARAHSTIG